MRAQEQALARRQLDKRLNELQKVNLPARPPRGWIKAIREALGMTAAQLGARLGVSQPRATKIESAEMNGSITLETLERAAHALDCQLVYLFVPRMPLEEQVRLRSQEAARRNIRAASHSMSLEDQSVDASEERAQIEALARELLARSPSRIWDGH